METQELDAAVGLLTRPSKHRVNVGGGYRWVTADPLLLQLVVEIANTSASPTFKGSGGNPIPIAADAYDLLCRIAEEVAEKWWQTFDRHHGVGRATLAGQLRAWAMVARTNPDDLAEATRIIGGYVSAIESLFAPVRRWEIIGPCPECKTARVIDHVDDIGHTITRTALGVFYSRDNQLAGASCAACGRTWDAAEVFDLARKMAEA